VTSPHATLNYSPYKNALGIATAMHHSWRREYG